MNRYAKDEQEEKALNDISVHGVHIISVFEDEEHPSFSYSVGLFENYAHSEIIIIGLKQELAFNLINNMSDEIKNGKTFTAGEYHEGVLDNYLCYFGDVPQTHYENYVGWCRWFYGGNNFPLVQCVYPTVQGKFRWDKDFPEDALWFCQLLTEPPKEH